MPRLEILIGMIASGKSTYARSRAAAGAMIVSHDELTQMLHGRYHYEAGNRTLYLQMMQDLAGEALRVGFDVLVDRTHLTREARKVWVDFARYMATSLRVQVQLAAVSFRIENPRIHTNRRMLSDARGRTFDEWDNATQHHYRQAMLEPLSWAAEGFAEHKEIEFDVIDRARTLERPAAGTFDQPRGLDAKVVAALQAMLHGPEEHGQPCFCSGCKGTRRVLELMGAPVGVPTREPEPVVVDEVTVGCTCGQPDTPGTVHRADGPCVSEEVSDGGVR